MILKKFQNKKAITVLGVIIIALICAPIIIIAFLKYNNGNYTVERVYYKSHGEINIAGLIYRPNSQIFPGKRPGVVCIHGFQNSKENVDRFSTDLARAGFVVLAYDQRGFGNSEGVSHLGDPDYEIKDLEISVKYLKSLDYVDSSAIGLTGIGYGGAISIMGAGILRNEITATFAISSYSNLTETFKHLNFNSIQANLIKQISKYIGYIPRIEYPNDVSAIQLTNLKGFIDLISDMPSMAEFKKFFIFNEDNFEFNRTALSLHSPIRYASKIRNNSLFLAVGKKDTIYPNNFSKSVKNLLLANSKDVYFQIFKNYGHNIDTYQLDSALVNFFNLKLRNIEPPADNLLKNPFIPELDTYLNFDKIKRSETEDESFILTIYNNIIETIPLIFLIPYVIAVILIFIFFVLLFLLESDLRISTKKEKKLKKKDQIQKYMSRKMIVRRIDKGKSVRKLEIPKGTEVIEDSYLYNKNLGVFVLVFTLINLIIIPTIGMSILNLNLLFFWITILILNTILSVVFVLKFESWDWKKVSDSKGKDLTKTEKSNQFFWKFVNKLKEKAFLQVIFYLLILFGVVLFIAFLIAPLQLNIVDFGFAQIFSTLILAGITITLVGLILIWFDMKYINSDNTIENYGLSKKQMLKGFSFGVYIIQIPLIILIISSYILIFPQPFLSKPYGFIYIGMPFIFLYFFGFELIFRVLIQNKIQGNKIGEFLIGSLFYGQFIAFFGYLIFMNSYSSMLLFSGLPVSYSGFFGLIFVVFAIIGTINYMITRTPIASSIANTLVLFLLIAILL